MCQQDSAYDPCIPNVLIEFDYDKVVAPPEYRDHLISSASVWVGFTDQYTDIIASTHPLALLNNINLLASYRRYM